MSFTGEHEIFFVTGYGFIIDISQINQFTFDINNKWELAEKLLDFFVSNSENPKGLAVFMYDNLYSNNNDNIFICLYDNNILSGEDIGESIRLSEKIQNPSEEHVNYINSIAGFFGKRADFYMYAGNINSTFRNNDTTLGFKRNRRI